MTRANDRARPLPAVGESFMQALRLDHGRLSRVLREIDAQQTRLSTAPESARPILAEAMRYLLHYQHAFHHPREDLLFARISAHAPQFGREMRALMREHRGGLRQAQRLATDLAHAPLSGLRQGEGARLARRLASYVAHTRAHMRGEEEMFYAQSERVLEAGDWAALAAEAGPDDPMGNRQLLAKDYPRLAEQVFAAVSDVEGHGDARDRSDATAPERAGRAVRDGAEQLAELCGELLHDGVDLARANLAALSAARSPWGLVRAAGPVGARSGRYVVRCLAEPPRLAFATLVRILSAWRPAGADSGASQGAP
jgi:hemerythrin-like domain-containing protein